MVQIHPTAVVEAGAKLGEGVEIGPFCLVGPEVEFAPGVLLESHVVVRGRTTVGARTRVWPFAVLGGEAQHHRHEGAHGRLVVGADCALREHVTAHAGSSLGTGVTRIGDGVTLMVSAHVAHDCVIGDRSVLANDVHLGGHVDVGAGVTIGGCCAVHQHVRIGDGAFVGGGSVLIRDVVPFAMAVGNRATVDGLNLVGLRRAGVPNDEIRLLQAALGTLLGGSGGTLRERLAEVRSGPSTPYIEALLSFVDAPDAGRRSYTPLRIEASRP